MPGAFCAWHPPGSLVASHGGAAFPSQQLSDLSKLNQDAAPSLSHCIWSRSVNVHCVLGPKTMDWRIIGMACALVRLWELGDISTVMLLSPQWIVNTLEMQSKLVSVHLPIPIPIPSFFSCLCRWMVSSLCFFDVIHKAGLLPCYIHKAGPLPWLMGHEL